MQILSIFLTDVYKWKGNLLLNAETLISNWQKTRDRIIIQRALFLSVICFPLKSFKQHLLWWHWGRYEYSYGVIISWKDQALICHRPPYLCLPISVIFPLVSSHPSPISIYKTLVCMPAILVWFLIIQLAFIDGHLRWTVLNLIRSFVLMTCYQRLITSSRISKNAKTWYTCV